MGLVICVVFLLLHVSSLGSLVTALALGKHNNNSPFLSLPPPTSSTGSIVLLYSSLGYFK